MLDAKLKGMDDNKLSIQEEINLIFKNVTKRQENLQVKVISKIRQKMKLNIEQLIYAALDRAVTRQSNLANLQVADLLYAVERRGEKYKNKVGNYLITAASFGLFKEGKIGEAVEDNEIYEDPDISEN